MPGKLMRYSGLITKTRAMAGKLLSKEEFRQLTELATVNEAISYLKGMAAYHSIYQGRDGEWHRGQAEAVIINSLYQDFEKLYRFADAGQRLALQYVFFRYEVDIIKSSLKYLMQKKEQEFSIDSFFCKHVCFNMDNLKKASNLQEFAQTFYGTKYEKVFQQIQQEKKQSYMDSAVMLDIFYYTSVFKHVRRMKDSELKKILLDIYGTQIDWLNIMWIYRSKRFYQQNQAELYKMLIPITYRLKSAELQGLVTATTLTDLNRILSQTSYVKGKEAFVKMENEISYRKTIETMYQRVSQRYAVSMAPVLKYIYEKEQEIHRLTTIIEGIRYQLPSKEIKDLVLITQ